MRIKSKLGLILFAVFGLLVVVAGDVFAVVGRPDTPVSAAGAARRTVRRGG